MVLEKLKQRSAEALDQIADAATSGADIPSGALADALASLTPGVLEDLAARIEASVSDADVKPVLIETLAEAEPAVT